jgi:HK97 family phage major capsid protein
VHITASLKEHLTKNFGLAATASDAEAQALVGEKLSSGELALTVYQDLTKNATGGSQSALESLIDKRMDAKLAPITDTLGGIAKALGLGGAAGGTGGAGNGGGNGGGGQPQQQAGNDGASLMKAGGFNGDTADIPVDAFTKALSSSAGAILAGGAPADGPEGTKAVNPAHAVMISGMGTSSNGGARVKSVTELYSNTKSAVTYDHSTNEILKKNWGGRPVISHQFGDGQHELNYPSQFEKAVIGSWFKYALHSAARRAGMSVPGMKLTEHDMQLVNYALHEMPFAGQSKFSVATDEGQFGFNNRKLFDYERKALLDDVLSGGLEAAPIVFDDAVIITPLLNGELFPLVNLVTVTRGRRIEAFSIGNPTFQWGIGEGTNVPLFNTDGLIAAFDTTINVATGAMVIGLDFEEDTPSNIGQIVIGRYGEAAKTDLDKMVAIGDGVIQPQGVFNASGTAAITSTNGNSGPPTLSDYSALQFGVTKPFRNDRCVYISNDQSYARSRNLKVDPSVSSTDERRLFGMDFQSYQTLGYRHRVQNDIANTKVGFYDLGRYRMYRRAGLSIAIERAGQSLVLSNQQLIVCRMRFGGALELGGAGAATTNAQS